MFGKISRGCRFAPNPGLKLANTFGVTDISAGDRARLTSSGESLESTVLKAGVAQW